MCTDDLAEFRAYTSNTCPLVPEVYNNNVIHTEFVLRTHTRHNIIHAYTHTAHVVSLAVNVFRRCVLKYLFFIFLYLSRRARNCRRNTLITMCLLLRGRWEDRTIWRDESLLRESSSETGEMKKKKIQKRHNHIPRVVYRYIYIYTIVHVTIMRAQCMPTRTMGRWSSAARALCVQHIVLSVYILYLMCVGIMSVCVCGHHRLKMIDNIQVSYTYFACYAILVFIILFYLIRFFFSGLFYNCRCRVIGKKARKFNTT